MDEHGRIEFAADEAEDIVNQSEAIYKGANYIKSALYDSIFYWDKFNVEFQKKFRQNRV